MTSFLVAKSLAMDLEDSIVKILSSHAYSGDTLQGSGFLFEHQGSFYVLTSEHVLVPEYQFANQHQIRIGEHWHRADLLALDWAAGLALLKIPQPPSNLNERKLLHFSDRQTILAPEIWKSDRVVAGGIPAESLNLKLSSFGRIENEQSPRPLFLDVPYTIEARGAATEVGMSGGLLINAQRKILGILAYREYDKDLTYAIPMSYAFKWLEDRFSNSKPITLGRAHLRNTGNRIEIIINSGEFNFRLFDDLVSVEYIPQSVVSPVNQQIQWDFLNPLRIPSFPAEIANQALDSMRQIYGSGTQRNLTPRERQMFELSQRIVAHGGKIFGLGFRRKGIENLTTSLVLPKDHIEFFKFVRNPEYVFIAQYTSPFIDYDNLEEDFANLANELIRAGNIIYTENILLASHQRNIFAGIERLVSFLRDPHHSSSRNQPYGKKLIDYLSAKELKEIENQRYCAELFSSHTQSTGLDLYRQRIGDLRKFVERFNY
jgi:hypothetical protein